MLHAPSDVEVGEPFDLKVTCFNGGEKGNLDPGFNGTLHFISTDADAVLPSDYMFTSTDSGRHTFPGVVLNQPGIHQIRAISFYNSTSPEIIPIPIRCSDKPIDIHVKSRKIYWGEFHGHTAISSDGVGDPDLFYPWARDVARLDFCMMSDHHHSIDSVEWVKMKDLAAAYLDPGKFVSFVGYEWGVGGIVGCNRNHQNIIYLGSDGDVAPDMDNLEMLWSFLVSKGKKCMSLPHHSGYPIYPGIGSDWNYYCKYFQHAVEIFSNHGCSEYYGNPFTLRWEQQGHSVRDALMKGYRFGIIGGSDNHRNRPGTNSRTVTPYAATGLAAVYTESLTRQSIFDAIRNRSCYATSGARKIILEFKVNNKSMGSEVYVTDPAVPRQLQISVAGTTKLRQVEVLKNGDLFFRGIPDSWKYTLTLWDTERVTASDFYYIRVTQEDNFQAWSSPIWVTLVEAHELPMFPGIFSLILLSVILSILLPGICFDK